MTEKMSHPLPPMKLGDPLFLLLLGGQIQQTLSVDIEEAENTLALLDAAAFGDKGNIQRYSNRLDERFFLFDEKSGDREIARRRFFVAIVVLLALQQGVSKILEAFPSTWIDGNLITQSEVQLLGRELDGNTHRYAETLARLTPQGWMAIHANEETLPGMDTISSERNRWKLTGFSDEQGSISALHLGILINRDPVVYRELLQLWEENLRNPSEVQKAEQLLNQAGNFQSVEPEREDKIIESWINVRKFEGVDKNDPRNVMDTCQHILMSPPAWVTWGSTTLHIKEKFYNRVFDLGWPGYPNQQDPPKTYNVLQALFLGQREINTLGQEGCRRAADRMAKAVLLDRGNSPNEQDIRKKAIVAMCNHITLAAQNAGNTSVVSLLNDPISLAVSKADRISLMLDAAANLLKSGPERTTNTQMKM